MRRIGLVALAVLVPALAQSATLRGLSGAEAAAKKMTNRTGAIGVLLLVALNVGSSVAKEAPTIRGDSPPIPLFHDGKELEGIAYAYGHRLRPPYVFSALDADTLRLNGVPFHPRTPTEETLAKVRLAEACRRRPLSAADSTHAAVSAVARDVWRETFRETGSQQAALNATRNACLADPSVGWAEILAEGVRVKYSFREAPIDLMLPTRHVGQAALSTPRQERERMVESFWMFMEKPSLFVFGRGYSLILDPTRAAQALSIVESVERGGARSEPPSSLAIVSEDLDRLLDDITRALNAEADQ